EVTLFGFYNPFPNGAFRGGSECLDFHARILRRSRPAGKPDGPREALTWNPRRESLISSRLGSLGSRQRRLGREHAPKKSSQGGVSRGGGAASGGHPAARGGVGSGQ